MEKELMESNDKYWILLHFFRATAITDDQARDAMIQFVSENCCYGTAPAREMVIKDVIPSSAYHVSTIFLDVSIFNSLTLRGDERVMIS